MNRNGQSDKCAWLEMVFDRYEVPLLRYVKSITQDGERARDIVHDTFLQLCSKERSEVEGHLAQWLFKVSRNRAMDVYRKNKRIRFFSEREAEGVESEDPSPDLVFERKETAHEILSLVQTLPLNQQEVIRLKFQCGLSYKEISQITDLILHLRSILAYGTLTIACFMVLFALVESPKSPLPATNELSSGGFPAEESQETRSLVLPRTPTAASETTNQNSGFYKMDPMLLARYGLLPPYSRRDAGEPSPRVKVSQSPELEPNGEDGLNSPVNSQTASPGEQVPPISRFNPYSRYGDSINSTNHESMSPDLLNRYGLGPARPSRRSPEWIRGAPGETGRSAVKNSRLTIEIPLTHKPVVFRRKSGDGADGSYDRVLFLDDQGRDGELAQADKLVVNIANTGGTRFAVARILLSGTSVQLIQSMNSNRHKLLDAANEVLASKTLDDINKPGFRNQLRQELLSRFSKVVGSDLIDEVIITESVIQ